MWGETKMTFSYFWGAYDALSLSGTSKWTCLQRYVEYRALSNSVSFWILNVTLLLWCFLMDAKSRKEALDLSGMLRAEIISAREMAGGELEEGMKDAMRVREEAEELVQKEIEATKHLREELDVYRKKVKEAELIRQLHQASSAADLEEQLMSSRVIIVNKEEEIERLQSKCDQLQQLVSDANLSNIILSGELKLGHTVKVSAILSYLYGTSKTSNACS